MEIAKTPGSAALRSDHVLLVVEDDELRDVLADLLTLSGFAPYAVASVQEARVLVDGVVPALLVVDLPSRGSRAAANIDGWFEVLATRAEAPPTLLLCDDEEVDLVDRYAVQHLRKPFGWYALLDGLRRTREERRRPSSGRIPIAKPEEFPTSEEVGDLRDRLARAQTREVARERRTESGERRKTTEK